MCVLTPAGTRDRTLQIASVKITLSKIRFNINKTHINSELLLKIHLPRDSYSSTSLTENPSLNIILSIPSSLTNQ